MPEQLTNEELAVLIQQGDRSKLSDLWEQVSRFVAWKAAKIAERLKNCAWAEYDDLYNAGFIALVEAVETYKANRGTFIAWFAYYLKVAFAQVIGYRTKAQKENNRLCAISLDKPLKDGEGDSIGDLVADPVDYMAEIEDQLYREQLRKALNKALDMIDDMESHALQLRFYDQKTLQQIGTALGVTADRARALEYNGLKKLRRSGARKNLESFIDAKTNFYLGTSAESQRSPVELLVIRREEMRDTANAQGENRAV